MIDERPYFAAGCTPGGAPHDIYLDEMDDGYLTGMITPSRPTSYPTWIYSAREHRHRSVLTSRHESGQLRNLLIVQVPSAEVNRLGLPEGQ